MNLRTSKCILLPNRLIMLIPIFTVNKSTKNTLRLTMCTYLNYILSTLNKNEKLLKQTLKLVYLLVVDNGKTIENIRVDKLLF